MIVRNGAGTVGKSTIRMTSINMNVSIYEFCRFFREGNMKRLPKARAMMMRISVDIAAIESLCSYHSECAVNGCIISPGANALS